MMEIGEYYVTYFNCKISKMHLTNFKDVCDLLINKPSLILLFEFCNEILQRLLANVPSISYTAVLHTYSYLLIPICRRLEHANHTFSLMLKCNNSDKSYTIDLTELNKSKRERSRLLQHFPHYFLSIIV